LLAEQRYKILFIQYVKEHLILTFYTTSQKEGKPFGENHSERKERKEIKGEKGKKP